MLKAGRRGEILIEPYMQLRFGFTFLLLNLFFTLMMISVFGYFMWDMFDAISYYFELSKQESLVTLTKFSYPASIGLALAVVFVLLTLYISARYTHQIYGPMVSIRRFLDDILAGKKPKPIQLRRTDQLQDLVARLNKVATQINLDESSSSLQKLEDYLDQHLSGQKPTDINLNESDPLYKIAGKIDQLLNK